MKKDKELQKSLVATMMLLLEELGESIDFQEEVLRELDLRVKEINTMHQAINAYCNNYCKAFGTAKCLSESSAACHLHGIKG